MAPAKKYYKKNKRRNAKPKTAVDKKQTKAIKLLTSNLDLKRFIELNNTAGFAGATAYMVPFGSIIGTTLWPPVIDRVNYLTSPWQSGIGRSIHYNRLDLQLMMRCTLTDQQCHLVRVLVLESEQILDFNDLLYYLEAASLGPQVYVPTYAMMWNKTSMHKTLVYSGNKIKTAYDRTHMIGSFNSTTSGVSVQQNHPPSQKMLDISVKLNSDGQLDFNALKYDEGIISRGYVTIVYFTDTGSCTEFWYSARLLYTA